VVLLRGIQDERHRTVVDQADLHVRTEPPTPVGNSYERLLDKTGELTAEKPTSATGHFRFFAAPGEWPLRTLPPKAMWSTAGWSPSEAWWPRWQSPCRPTPASTGAARSGPRVSTPCARQ